MKTEVKTCRIEGCTNKYKSAGLCGTHYERQRTGLPLETRKRATFDENGYKWCNGCEQDKHLDDYYNGRQSSHGKTSRCKVCIDKVNLDWRTENPEKYQTAQANWRAANEGYTYTERGSGYVKYIGYNHPAASSSGVTGYHRIVLWDKMGGQNDFCYWGCGTFLRWEHTYPKHKDALCVDHLNGVRDDNRPENLVPSCNVCNTSISRRTRSGQPMPKPCSAQPCDRTAEAKGMCRAHYLQQWKGLDPRPIRAYMDEERDKAIVQFITDGLTMSEVAQELNTNVSLVSRAVERVTGMPVREYRASLKNGEAA